MRNVKAMAALGFVFFAACATTTKAPTSQQRIADVGQSFEETDKRLVQVEEELQSFSQSIAKLRESASGAEKMRSKPGFDEALGRLGSRVEQAQLDLQALKTANARGRNTYDRQVDEAATQIQKSSDANQAE